MDEFEAQKQISAAYNEGKRDGYEQARKEFADRRSYVLSWLNGDRVYHEGFCYVFPHGKQHIVKILKR